MFRHNDAYLLDEGCRQLQNLNRRNALYPVTVVSTEDLDICGRRLK